jgi:hypothetical protein
MSVPYVHASSRPASEGCLLQIVSLLAREPWTDRPTCVHPTLGSIARVAHDCCSESGRAALRPLAPQFVGTARPGFATSARLVALCVSTALASPDRGCITEEEDNRLFRWQQTAMHLLRRSGSCGEEPRRFESCPGSRLRGASRWWFPMLEPLRLAEPFYRAWVSGEQAAEAVAVTARASGTEADRRIQQLVRACLSVAGPASPGGLKAVS